MYTYANKIKDYRQREGITQTEMAQKLGLAQPNYARLETGKLDIKISLLIKICKELNVSADWLLGLSD